MKLQQLLSISRHTLLLGQLYGYPATLAGGTEKYDRPPGDNPFVNAVWQLV
jgi:hypothetical protein